MKKILLSLLSSLSILFAMPLYVYAADNNEEIAVPYSTKYVNQSYPITMLCDGCIGHTNIKVNGQYNVYFQNGQKKYNRIYLNTTASGHPGDWTVEIVKSTYTGTPSGLQVEILYRFLGSRWECPQGGGWKYQILTVTV